MKLKLQIFNFPYGKDKFKAQRKFKVSLGRRGKKISPHIQNKLSCQLGPTLDLSCPTFLTSPSTPCLWEIEKPLGPKTIVLASIHKQHNKITKITQNLITSSIELSQCLNDLINP